ncbi:MAG: hypothetical protein SOW22_06375 [Candidatus Egerieousia sp.]|nr:hypothetical protein [Candidatus Egerieousia sp.]
MKKIIYLFAAAATLLAASCNKIETTEQEITPDAIQLNIKVANLTGTPDTKAAKTGWVSGDKINIWFDNWNNTEQEENHIPDMVITYDGSVWKVSSQVSGLSARLKSNGKLTALFEGFNDLSKYTYDYDRGEWFHPANRYLGVAADKVYNSPMVVYAEGLSYSYSAGTITADLENWNFYTTFKVLLKNDNSKLIHSAEKYYLQVKNITANTYAGAKGAIIVNPRSDYPTIGEGSSNYSGFAAGVQEADGIAFYYNSLSASSADIQFTLYNGQDATISTFTATGKTVTCNEKKCTGVAINYSKFTTLSSALSGSFSVSNTKKVHFSHGNLRYTVSSGIWDFYPNQYDCASTYESNVISLFNWGYNETQSIIPNGSFTDNVNRASGDLIFEQDWGYHVGVKNTWRTLTTKEWQYLFNEGDVANATRAGLYAYGVTVAGKANCTVLYPDGFSGTKVSNGDLTSYDTAAEWEAAQNEGVVCLPAVGSRSGASVSNVGVLGNYWSSTANDSNNAYIVYFSNSNLLPGSYNKRDYGYAVRLVTDAK